MPKKRIGRPKKHKSAVARRSAAEAARHKYENSKLGMKTKRQAALRRARDRLPPRFKQLGSKFGKSTIVRIANEIKG